MEDLSPKQVADLLLTLKNYVEPKNWLKRVAISYIYVIVGQLEAMQTVLDKQAAKALKAAEPEVTVEPVANASETLSSQKQLEQAKMQEASNELLKRLTQSKPL